MAAKGVMILMTLGALVTLVMMAQPANASSFVGYSGHKCSSGCSWTLSACGCNTIPAAPKAAGGYVWTYDGQTGAAYNQPGCTGVAQTHFTGSVSSCSPFGWQSFFIQC